MRTARIAFLALLGLVSIGCGDKPAADVTSGGVTSGVTEPVKGPVVPDSLKHAAYDYLGLANGDIMTYDVTFGDLPKEDGTQQTTLEKSEGAVATYKVGRTGGLSRLGVDTVELRADGVWTVATSMGLLKEASELLPAEIAPGLSWDARMDMDNLQGGTQNVVSKIVNVAKQVEKVKVPAGEFDCLAVVSTFDATISGSPDSNQNGKTTTRVTTYYAKGVGIVKLSGTTTRQDGSKQNVVIELKARAAENKTAVSGDSAANPAETKGQ